MTRRHTISLADVARVAGVSTSTASRALNGSNKPVSSELRLRIGAVADSLGYVSDRAAQALRGRRTAVFMLIPDPREPVIAQAAGMEVAARQRDVLASAVAVGAGPAAHIKAIQTLSHLHPKALIVNYYEVDSATVLPYLRRFADDGGRVITMGQTKEDFSCVLYHDIDSGRLMGDYLSGLGRSSWAIITARHPALSDRVQGVLEAMGNHRMNDPLSVVVTDDLSREQGRLAMRRVWESGLRPEIVYAANDILAIGAMEELRSLGVRIPEEVSVAGNDDIPIARDLTPALTTVRLNFMAAGRIALEMALSEGEPTTVDLPGELIIRASTSVS